MRPSETNGAPLTGACVWIRHARLGELTVYALVWVDASAWAFASAKGGLDVAACRRCCCCAGDDGQDGRGHGCADSFRQIGPRFVRLDDIESVADAYSPQHVSGRRRRLRHET